MTELVKEFALRLMTVAVFFFFFYATAMSLRSNPSPKWFDLVSALPFFYICYSMIRGGNALERALDKQRDDLSAAIARITSRK